MKNLFVVVLLAISSFCAVAADVRQTPARTITFVCEHGVAKSVIAAQHFNKLAKARGLNYIAVARGIKSEPQLQAATLTGLRGDGFELATFTPTDLSAADSETSARIVLIGVAKVPEFLHSQQVEYWQGVPSVSNDYAAARDDMVARIVQLMATLPQ